MNDIVERLSGLYDDWNSPHSSPDGLPTGANIMLDAAAEITRLRNELHAARVWAERAIAEHEQDIMEIAHLRTEIERLRVALGDVHAAAKDNHLIANIARAALEKK